MNWFVLTIELILFPVTAPLSLPRSADVNLVFPHVADLMDFLNSIAIDEDRSESNTSCSVGLLGCVREREKEERVRERGRRERKRRE